MTTDLTETIRRCEKWLGRYHSQGRSVGEQNTKAGLIEPILEALGWDVRDPDEVCREYRRLSSDNPVDYALLILRTPRLFVEAKGVGVDLDDRKWANQTIAYATAAGVEWVVLSNGAEWRIYNAHAPVPIEQKLFRSVSIDADPDEVIHVLRLLGKDNMGENRIAALWKTNFVDRQVRDVLVELFAGGEPARELVSLVRHRVPGLALHDVRQSLARARASFEFPVVAEPAQAHASGHEMPRDDHAPLPPLHSKEALADGNGQRQQRLSSRERETSLAVLVERGELVTGSTIESNYGRRRHVATLLDGGRVRFDGVEYPSLSKAGEAVKIAHRGPDIPDSIRATDGWSFWRAPDRSTGDLVTLRELRRRVAARTEP